MFALEMGVEHSFRVVKDLTSTDAREYGGHPALRVPVLETARGSWFGALNISRELWRLSSTRPRVVWPEDLDTPLLANAQELVLQAMANEVSLIMAKVSGAPEGNAYLAKTRTSLTNTLAWLEEHVREALAALPPERALSYLEVTLLCLVTHLEFREVLPVSGYPRLQEFCAEFGARESAVSTRFHFDR